MLDFNTKITQQNYESPLVELMHWTDDVLAANGSPTDTGDEYPEDSWG